MARTKKENNRNCLKGKHIKDIDRETNVNLMKLLEESTLTGEKSDGGPVKNISRKVLRKKQRKLKKLKKQAHQLKKQGKLEQVLPLNAIKVNKNLNESKKKINHSNLKTQIDSTYKSDFPAENSIKSLKNLKKSPAQQKETMQKEQKQQRVKQLKIANRLEDKNIKKMEKQLKMNKRKTKSIPKSFVDDGLDFLLEVCDPEKRSALAHEEFDFADNDAGFEDDLALLNAKEIKIKRPKKLSTETAIAEDSEELSAGEENVDMSDCDESNTIEDSAEYFSGEDAESDFEVEDNTSNQCESVNPDEVKASADADEISGPSMENMSDLNQEGCWEDIYGRLRDKGGKVIETKSQQASSGKYIPPGKRLQDAIGSSTSAEMEKLKRQMKGFFNRLAEANLPGIVSSIEQLYLTNARHNMQEAINILILDSLVTPVLSPERLIMEHCVLVAALHANIGTEVGAQFLEVIVRRFHALYEDSESHVEDKTIDNLILILSHLYNFNLVAAPLLTGILNKLAERFSEKDIELILIVLRSVGFALRKDDPISLKQIIFSLQAKAGQIANQPNRVRFMLDILLAIRNNNVAKIPNYDPSHSEHLRKILRNTLIRKSASLSKMNITYNELLAADRRGRWWVVGSAWVGQGPAITEAKLENTDQVGGKELQFSAELLEMARKQRMNTDIRRNIFCILMTAEDFLEANERLLRLNLKSQQEREIIHVTIDCCLHEVNFNPYYAHVVQKFCHLHRRFQIATQFALWDRFKDLTSLSTLQVAHLAKLLVQLISDGAQNLSVLKVIQFTEMDRRLVRFLRQILLGLLLHPSETAVLSAFQRVSSSKYYLLKEGLTLFIHHFLLKNVDKMELHDAEKIKQRVHLAEQVLNLGLT